MGAGKKMNTVLIIERDSEKNSLLISAIEGIYNIILLSDIDEGAAYLQENKDDISAVLLDFGQYPGKCGDFLNEIHNDIRLFSIPLLLIAGENETSEEAELLKLGYTDCIHTPIHREAVRKRIANAIRMKNSLSVEEMENMLRELPSNIYLKDSRGRYIFATHYWHHLDKSDDPDWTIKGKTDIEIRKDKENAAEALKADLELISTGKGTAYTIEINEDGIQEFFEIIKQPIKNDKGKVAGIIGLINHVTEYEQMKRKLEEIVRTDELTGLYSRYYFDEYLRDLQKKGLYPICVISADCDGLKSINDTYGHLVGDEYIRMASLLFRIVLPKNGAAFRTGGDEFIILLPSAGEEEARDYIDRMKEKEQLFRIRGQQLSVSFGLSSIKSSSESAEDCIAASDMNMYAAKRQKKAQEKKTEA